MYAQYGSTSGCGYTYLPPVTPVLSVADMIPPPPPPPGEGPLEGMLLVSCKVQCCLNVIPM